MKVAIKSMPRCRVCKRPLANPKSIANGIGPECAETFAAMLAGAGLTLELLEIPEQFAADVAVARYRHFAECALLAGRAGDVERFKRAAREAANRAAMPAAA